MGYYVQIWSADFGIPEENWDAAFEAVCELNKHDELKTGGSWGPNGKEEVWFAWMPKDYPAEALAEYEEKKLPHPLVWVFQQLGFDWEMEDGEFRLTAYDSKTGAEDHFLEAVAPYVRPGSSLEWSGEDGEKWIEKYDGKTVSRFQGRIVYDQS